MTTNIQNKSEGATSEALPSKPDPLVLIPISNNTFSNGIWTFEAKKVNGELNLKLKALNREGVLLELKKMGYQKRNDAASGIVFIKANENILTEVTVTNIKEAFYKKFIKHAKDMEVELGDRIYTFLKGEIKARYLDQFHLIFNQNFLEHLETHTKPILRDTEGEAFFCYQNGIVKATRQGYSLISYTSLNETCVWDNHILKRDFNKAEKTEGSYFADFLLNVAAKDKARQLSFISAFGYLLHNYNSPTKSQAVLLYDAKPAPKGKPEGGSGKGLFVQAVKKLRETTKIDGKNLKSDNRFKFQKVTPQTQVIWLDDVHAKFDFSELHSNISDGWNIERKYADEFFIPHNESPKVVIASNTILTTEGSTNKRRQYIVEFDDHYQRKIITGTEEPILQEHGCIFFSEQWTKADWAQFDTLAMECITDYLKKGLSESKPVNIVLNRLMQRTNEDFTEWVRDIDFTQGAEHNLKELFESFKQYSGEDTTLKQATFTRWVRFYCELSNVKVKRVKKGNNWCILVTNSGIRGD